ncbi:MAG: TadE family type IV pilus minor pilin [Actinomycetota bacterium]
MGRICSGSCTQRPASSERGQASVEFALVLPLVLLVLLGLLQVGVFMLEKLQVSGAAREGAREAAVTADEDRIEQAAKRAAPGMAISVEVDRGPKRGDPAVVAVSAEPTELPLMGEVVTNLPLKSSATMRVEKVDD